MAWRCLVVLFLIHGTSLAQSNTACPLEKVSGDGSGNCTYKIQDCTANPPRVGFVYGACPSQFSICSGGACVPRLNSTLVPEPESEPDAEEMKGATKPCDVNEIPAEGSEVSCEVDFRGVFLEENRAVKIESTEGTINDWVIETVNGWNYKFIDKYHWLKNKKLSRNEPAGGNAKKVKVVEFTKSGEPTLWVVYEYQDRSRARKSGRSTMIKAHKLIDGDDRKLDVILLEVEY